ncbi:unnamed protein product [Effrenium voratum]|nr:unnamed protein product [Effrenium voratum]
MEEIRGHVFGELFPGLNQAAWPNSANINLYRDGRQGVGWHADDELLFRGKDSDCPVVSISLGAARAVPAEFPGPRIHFGPGERLDSAMDLDDRLAEVLRDLQCLRQANRKLDQVLKARMGCEVDLEAEGKELFELKEEKNVSFEAPQVAPEDSLVDEPQPAEPGKRVEDHWLEELPEAADVPPADMPQEGPSELGFASQEALDSQGAFTQEERARLCYSPTFEEVQDFTVAKETEAEQAFAAPEAKEDEAEAEDPELDAMWESFFPAPPAEEADDVPLAPPEEAEAVPAANPEAAEGLEPAQAATQAQPTQVPPTQVDVAEKEPKAEDVFLLSRRERIRLLEREGAARVPETEEAREDRDVPLRAEEAAAALQRRRQEESDTPKESQEKEEAEFSRRRRIAELERGMRGEHITPQEEEENADASWLEARREHRKARLAPRPRSGRGNSEKANMPEEATVMLPQQAVEGLGRHECADPEYLDACEALAVGAHKLSTGSLLRAVDLMLGRLALAPPELTGDLAAEPIRRCGEALLGALAGQMTQLGMQALMNCLRLMVLSGVQEQTFLDMLLAQLLVLSRRESAALTPRLPELCGGLGALQRREVSARRGASSSNCAANRRCVEMIARLLTQQVPELKEEDLATVGHTFVVTFMDDLLRRAFIRQAACLLAGLRESPEWVTKAMVEVEEAVRTQSFAFIASLPDESKDYLMQLKILRRTLTPPTEVPEEFGKAGEICLPPGELEDDGAVRFL